MEILGHRYGVAHPEVSQLLRRIRLGAVNGVIHVAMLNNNTRKIQCPRSTDNSVIIGSAAVQPCFNPFIVKTVLGHFRQLKPAEGLSRRIIFSEG